MELRHLRYFVAIAEDLNYRKASERLRVAQPALSSQIQDLEQDVGVRLLDRDTGGVRLTDAGAAFLEEARLIITHAQRAAGIARDAAKGRRGRINIGYYAPLVMGFMPESLKAFHAKYPDVDVALHEMSILDQTAALESGAIHVGFSLGGAFPIPATLKSVEVARSPIRAVVGRSHRLARQAQVSLIDLIGEPLICLQVKRGFASIHGEIMRNGFEIRGLKPGPIRGIEGAEAFRATLESGLGVSLIAEIGGLSRSPDLVFKPLKESGDDLFVELYAVWRNGDVSQLTANFVSVIREVAPKLRSVAKQPARRSRAKR